MKLTIIFLMIGIVAFSSESYSQSQRLNLDMKNAQIVDVLNAIEQQSEFYFFFKNDEISGVQKVNAQFQNETIDKILSQILNNTGLSYKIVDRYIVISPSTDSTGSQQIDIQKVLGKVTDTSGAPIPGVAVLVKGTTQGTITDADGNYTLSNVRGDASLVFSFVGMKAQEIPVAGKNTLNVILEAETIGIEEVVAIGYGTMRKSDLTGSVSQIGESSVIQRSTTSLTDALQGASAGLNVGQVNTVGGQPSITIRGRTSISGVQNPLIVLDGVIFRGRLIDINPNDISTIDVLKDASSTAIYGSQATNGVIIVTTKTAKASKKPIINYTCSYSFQEPSKNFETESPEEFLQRVEAAYFFDSRTEESGYLEPNGTWDITTIFPTPEQLDAYSNNKPTDWYNLLTNDNMFAFTHNLSMANRNETSGYFISMGYTEQQGYMVNDDYNRWNARINIDNSLTDWMKIGVQSFFTSSDYSGLNIAPSQIYNHAPFAPAYNEDGSYVTSPNSTTINPLYVMEADNLDKNINLFGNIYADINIPFIKGLSFRTNFGTNYYTTSDYTFQTYADSFIGRGAKSEGRRTEWSNDNILTYKRSFNEKHDVNIMAGYGREKREYTSTTATATGFNSHVLGYNNLQAGTAELQTAASDAWLESSLYYMGRIHYRYDDKYLFTGTIRRDGFSGFSEKHKYGVFPSVALAWDASKETFLKDNLLREFDQFKIRVSYGANGNRTIGRYQTLAKVGDGYRYVDADGVSLYAKDIATLASPNLKWETTTGINFGLDYSVLNSRLSGSIEYYSNNTTDLLYNVDIPGISRFQTFPDNLGKLHNNGIELAVSSVNINKSDFKWTSQFNFSRVRDELKELLGFDNDGDGKEDDLVSEGLFIGESLGTIYTYYTNGDIWQFGDEIPATADVGSYKIEDFKEDGVIDPDDRKIIGYNEPSYRFSIGNDFTYKNWELSIFINSVQGSDKYYLGQDEFDFIYPNSTAWNRDLFPRNMDFWLPENPDARYERLGVEIAGGIKAWHYIPRSFIRLQDVNLAYDFKSNFLNKYHIQSLRLYFHGKNLYTWTKWPGWDPETGEGITRSGRPVTRSFTFGIDVKF
ncbi:TonB-dependent receptor [Gaoshiqia sediminis]|uniref:TonB-dependent receptor n=1 Tax=Gaoshiqia sediminis TaxID=2986998 RepID=A0AA41Y5S7_9BACT|nr:TonB-dependent receptor [Gaoshiqia sediminis]MCW0483936.1 TonB-dependent receptor [Gaoshiqia sediminis]